MKEMLAQLAQAFANPDLKHKPPAGQTLDGKVVATIAQPNDNSLIVQRHAKRDHWSEVDVLEPGRFLTLYIFGAQETGFLAFAAAEYFNADHTLAFDAPDWHAGTDMLLMVATASDERTLAARVLGVERDLPLDAMLKDAMAPVLALAQAFEQHRFAEHLAARAMSRNRSRLYLHVEGKNNRFRQLVKGLGFVINEHEHCTVLTKNVGN